MQAEIITIGDEILIGQIVDTNSAWMAKQLNAIGLAVKQITSVSDDSAHITEALQQALNRADVVLITGGLGPTRDDITKATLSKFFNMPLRRDATTLANVESIFARFNRPMLEINRQQADVPDGCTVIQNIHGTAPCMWFDIDGKVVVSMPGVPFEMMYLMEEQILPKLRTSFKMPFIYHKTLLTGNIGESYLAEKISKIEDDLPTHIKLAYLPKLGQVRLRLSATGWDESSLHTEVEKYASMIVKEVKEYIIIEDDIPLEKAILQFMEARKLTLSTAESCTGGFIGHLITQHPGCSSVYFGGAITYAYELKKSVLGVKTETLEHFGAVSEETVSEMAAGAVTHFNTDYALAVSGIAGPGGETADKPVGTVWVAVASRSKTIAKLFHFHGKRQQNIERSATAALLLLLNQLKEDYN